MKSTYKPVKAKEDKRWIYIIAAFFLLIVFHNFFGAIAYNVIVIIDNTFNASGANSPVFIWSLVGGLLGICIGCIIACRKFRLNRKISLLAALPILMVLILLFANAGQLYPIHPTAALSIKTDTALSTTDPSIKITNSPVAVSNGKQSRQKKIKKEIPVSTCINQIARVSLTVKSDSVKLYFRTSIIKDGEWSDWDSIFIPQPGQYALSGKRGKVFANSIQYYYEVKQEAIRSPGNPFTKSLCTGPLHIDTY